MTIIVHVCLVCGYEAAAAQHKTKKVCGLTFQIYSEDTDCFSVMETQFAAGKYMWLSIVGEGAPFWFYLFISNIWIYQLLM